MGLVLTKQGDKYYASQVWPGICTYCDPILPSYEPTIYLPIVKFQRENLFPN